MIRYTAIMCLCIGGTAALAPGAHAQLGVAEGEGTANDATTNNAANPEASPTLLTIIPGAGLSALPPEQNGPLSPPAPQVGPGTLDSLGLNSGLFGTSALSLPGGSLGAGALSPGIPVWGPIDLHPHLLYNLQYADGLQTQPGTQKKGWIDSVYPGFLFTAGTVWRLDYTPSYTVYSDPALKNTLGQAVLLSGATTYRDWAFNLNQTYSHTDDPLIQTGAQTSQDQYDTTLAASYQLNSKVALQFAAVQSLRFAQAFDNVEAWTGVAAVNYQWTPHFGTGLSLSGGYNDVSDGSSIPFEQLQATLNYRPGKKLSLKLAAGAEDLQFVDPTGKTLVTPTYSGSLRYQIARGTFFSLSGSRSVSPSYFGNDILISTQVGAALQQQLTTKLSLGLNAGYLTQPLTTIVPGFTLPRYFIGTPPSSFLQEIELQNSSSVGARLTYAAGEHLSAAVYVSVADNTSNEAALKYTTTLTGLTLNYRY